MVDESKYKYLLQFLIFLLEGTYIEKVEKYEGDERKKIDTLEFAKECDIDNITYFIKECTIEAITWAVSEGKEFLKIEPFPADWVGENTNRYPFNKKWDEVMDQDYYEWLKWLINNLEIEAKKAGKYTE